MENLRWMDPFLWRRNGVFCFGSSPELGGGSGVDVPRGTVATFGRLRLRLDCSMFHVEQKEAEDGSWQG